MVKTICLTLFSLLVLCLEACSPAHVQLAARVESAAVAEGRLSGPLSLLDTGGGLLAVFADRETSSLAVIELGPGLPAGLAAPKLLDRIDTEPPLSAAFGEHAAAVTSRGLALLYRDRQSESKTLLKLALRVPGRPEWRLALREPSGSPLAVLAREDGGVDCAWAAPLGLYLGLGSAQPEAFQPGFQPVGRASTAAALRAFSAFDGSTRKLWWFRLAAAAPQAGWIEGPGPVHAAAERAGEAHRGLLAIASFDAASRRVALWEEQQGGRFSRTTVTVCEGTRELFLAPWGHGYLIVYDERVSLGAGREVSQVSLLAPSGPRYRKKILSRGEQPVAGMACLQRGSELEVLTLRGEQLALLRVVLPPAGAWR